MIRHNFLRNFLFIFNKLNIVIVFFSMISDYTFSQNENNQDSSYKFLKEINELSTLIAKKNTDGSLYYYRALDYHLIGKNDAN